MSTQVNWDDVHDVVLDWVTRSANAGQPWVVANDEQGGAGSGIKGDSDFSSLNDHQNVVGQVLYGALMAGGAGVEAYFG